jgi:hypothetical protein
MLRDQLSSCIGAYSAAVCYANLGALKPEADHDLFRRDLIAVLIRELDRDFDLTEVKSLVRTLDANLPSSEENTVKSSPGRIPLDKTRVSMHPNGNRIES